MGKSNESYEVWIEKVGGKWTALSEEDGSIKLFPDQKSAYTEAMSYSNEGTALRACIFRRILVEEIGCAGRAVAKKMGLDRPNVHIEGGVKVGPPHKSQMFKKPPERV